MKISELPPGLKELAELRGLQCESLGFLLNSDDLEDRFYFRETPEGFLFWMEIYEGNFTPFYNCKVVNFKLKEK